MSLFASRENTRQEEQAILDGLVEHLDATEVPLGRTGVTSTASWDHTRNTSETRNTVLTNAERERHAKARAEFDAKPAHEQPELWAA